MRKSPIVDALFPDIRGRILAATLQRPDKPWYLSELSIFLGTRPSSLQREVDALTKAGILEQWREGRRVYLKPDRKSPVFADLRQLFEKTTGLIPVLQQELASLEDRIRCAFLYGSTARSREVSDSDVDMMVIGTAGLSDLIPGLRRAERKLGRPVNATVYSTEEFQQKVRSRDHFLNAVLAGPKQFIKGSVDELAAVPSER